MRGPVIGVHQRDPLIFIHKHAAIPAGLFPLIHRPVSPTKRGVQRFTRLDSGYACRHRDTDLSISVGNFFCQSDDKV